MSKAESPFNESGQYAWDATSIKLAEECLAKYRYVMIDGWTSEHKSVHLLFGGWYATALENFHKLRAMNVPYLDAVIDVVHEALIATWNHELDANGFRIVDTGSAWESDHNTKTRENLIRTIIWYLDQFEDDPAKTMILGTGKAAVEYSFSLPVDNGLIFSGHIDRFVEYAGRPYVQDQKTTGTTITQRFFESFSPDTQMCQPAGTMVSTPKGDIPIETITEHMEVISYHNDFPSLRAQPVTGVAVRDFVGHLVYLGVGQYAHRVTPSHRVLMKYTRSFKYKHAVYIMRKGNSFRVGTVQISSTRDGGMNGISQRCRNEKADAMWVLELFDSRKEAWMLEQLISVEYGIPQVTFKAGNFKRPASLKEDQLILDLFWSRIGFNRNNAVKALEAHGRMIEYPIYSTEDKNAFGASRAQMVRACNIFPGVTQIPVVTETGDVEWAVAEIAYEPYVGKVYSLDVKKVGRTNYDGCYVANKIITGNSMYTFAGKMIYNIPVHGVMIDAAQIAVGFSRFERGFTFRTEDQLNEWYDITMYHIEKARTAFTENYFPMNTTACGNYGGCPFRSICSKSPAVREQYLKGTYVQKKPWNPLEVR